MSLRFLTSSWKQAEGKNTGLADTHGVILTLLGRHAASWLPSSVSLFVCMVLSHWSVGTGLRLVRGCFLLGAVCLFVCFGSVLNNFSLSPSVVQSVNALTSHWAEHTDGPVGIDCFFFPLLFTSFTLCKNKLLTVKPQNNTRGKCSRLLGSLQCPLSGLG